MATNYLFTTRRSLVDDFTIVTIVKSYCRILRERERERERGREEGTFPVKCNNSGENLVQRCRKVIEIVL